MGHTMISIWCLQGIQYVQNRENRLALYACSACWSVFSYEISFGTYRTGKYRLAHGKKRKTGPGDAEQAVKWNAGCPSHPIRRTLRFFVSAVWRPGRMA